MNGNKINSLLVENPDGGVLNGKKYIHSINSISFFITEDGLSSITFPSFIKSTHGDVLSDILQELEKADYPNCDLNDIKISPAIEIVGNKKQVFDLIYDHAISIVADDSHPDDELPHYRMIFITGRYWPKLKLICVWDDFNTMEHSKRVELIDFMREEKLVPENFMFGDKGDGHINYEEFIQGKSTGVDNSGVDIKRIKHIMDPMVKHMIKTKNYNLRPNQYQALADKMGITQAELRNILGRNGD
jgi:hypothetical protein